jgi:hypothetical protein
MNHQSACIHAGLEGRELKSQRSPGQSCPLHLLTHSLPSERVPAHFGQPPLCLTDPLCKLGSPLVPLAFKLGLFTNSSKPLTLSLDVKQRQPGSGPQGIYFMDVHSKNIARIGREVSLRSAVFHAHLACRLNDRDLGRNGSYREFSSTLASFRITRNAIEWDQPCSATAS